MLNFNNNKIKVRAGFCESRSRFSLFNVYHRPLRDGAKPLPDEIKTKIEDVELSEKLCNGDKKKVRQSMEFLISYYIANRQPDTEWIQHPTISFDAYLGPSFSKKHLPKIPRNIITRDERQVGGTSRYKVNPEFLP